MTEMLPIQVATPDSLAEETIVTSDSCLVILIVKINMAVSAG